MDAMFHPPVSGRMPVPNAGADENNLIIPGSIWLPDPGTFAPPISL